MTHHPDENTLTDYIKNKLSDRMRIEIEHHLRSCSDCVTALSLAQNIPDKFPEVPQHMIDKAKNIPFERGDGI